MGAPRPTRARPPGVSGGAGVPLTPGIGGRGEARDLASPARRVPARLRVVATGRVQEQETPKRRRRPLPPPVATELAAVGGPSEVARLERRLQEATRAYEHDRYGEALPILRELARRVPGVGAIRELHGLTLYRLGRWRDAVRELRAFAELSGSVDQHPVIADCARALGHHGEVEAAWTELRQAGAGSDVLAEGRLVMAGSLADQGRVPEAIALLARAVAGREVRRPLERHVRQWYALADLYERSGEIPEAREWFRRVVAADPETADAPERLAALR